MNGDAAATLAVSVVLIAALAALVAWYLVNRRHRAIVAQHSAALAQLGHLNLQYRPRLSYYPVLQYTFVERVNSKARFDRYDLRTYFLESIGRREAEIEGQIAARLRDAATFTEYRSQYEGVAKLLGTSSTDLLGADRFRKIEYKLFAKGQLAMPQCAAQVVCGVSYTSPQGRNSYSRASQWDFAGLQQGLQEMKRIRDSRTTTQFLRQAERNKMSGSLRAQVLRRDGSRCKMCGASVSDGVKLHVDHVVPVSRGGLTVLDNLQALCQECNLGKSNRF